MWYITCLSDYSNHFLLVPQVRLAHICHIDCIVCQCSYTYFTQEETLQAKSSALCSSQSCYITLSGLSDICSWSWNSKKPQSKGLLACVYILIWLIHYIPILLPSGFLYCCGCITSLSISCCLLLDVVWGSDDVLIASGGVQQAVR